MPIKELNNFTGNYKWLSLILFVVYIIYLKIDLNILSIYEVLISLLLIVGGIFFSLKGLKYRERVSILGFLLNTLALISYLWGLIKAFVG